MQRDTLPGLGHFSAGALRSFMLATMQEAAGVLKEGFLVKRVSVSVPFRGDLLQRGISP